MELLCTQSPIRYSGVNTTLLCAGTQALVPGDQVWRLDSPLEFYQFRSLFLERPSNFSGLKANFEIKTF